MAGPSIVYTPDTVSRTVDFDSLNAILTRFRGGMYANREMSVSAGGKAVHVVHDVWWQYDVQLRGMVYPVGAADATRLYMQNLQSFLAHSRRGGQFAFAVDSTNTYTTALNGARSVSGTTLTVDATTSMAAGDWLHIEDLDDPTKWERTVIESVDSGTQVTIPSCDFAYVDNSVVRYHEYFPTCVVIDDKPIFVERDAGKGAYWDLSFTFRTVR